MFGVCRFLSCGFGISPIIKPTERLFPEVELFPSFCFFYKVQPKYSTVHSVIKLFLHVDRKLILNQRLLTGYIRYMLKPFTLLFRQNLSEITWNKNSTGFQGFMFLFLRIKKHYFNKRESFLWFQIFREQKPIKWRTFPEQSISEAAHLLLREIKNKKK